MMTFTCPKSIEPSLYGHGSVLSFEPKCQCSIVPNQAYLSLSVDQDICTFLDAISAMDICCNNRPRSIYQYSNMAPRLSGQTSIFGVVFFVSKSLLGIEGQRKLGKFAILIQKPRSHARILIYQTWPIDRSALLVSVVDAIVILMALLVWKRMWWNWLHCALFSSVVHCCLWVQFATLWSRPALFKQLKHTWFSLAFFSR